MRVDDADGVARDVLRMGNGLPLLVELRRRVDHPRVDEDEPGGMLDRVDVYREALDGAGEMGANHVRRLSRMVATDAVEVRSPYSGKVVGTAPRSGAADARRAIDAAALALESPLPAHKRAEILVKTAGLIGRRHEEVARTISEEAGKPIKTARVEASRAMSTYTFAAVEARKLVGEMIPMDAAQAGEGKLAFTLRRPIGVVGAISPFNFPCNLVAHKIAPA